MKREGKRERENGYFFVECGFVLNIILSSDEGQSREKVRCVCVFVYFSVRAEKEREKELIGLLLFCSVELQFFVVLQSQVQAKFKSVLEEWEYGRESCCVSFVSKAQINQRNIQMNNKKKKKKQSSEREKEKEKK